jgi:hypothetical protein
MLIAYPHSVFSLKIFRVYPLNHGFAPTFDLTELSLHGQSVISVNTVVHLVIIGLHSILTHVLCISPTHI